MPLCVSPAEIEGWKQVGCCEAPSGAAPTSPRRESSWPCAKQRYRRKRWARASPGGGPRSEHGEVTSCEVIAAAKSKPRRTP